MLINDEAMKAMAERIANKIRVSRRSIDKYENKRECPFFSERIGMEQALKTLGIGVEYEYDDDRKIIAVRVNGVKAEV